MATTVQTKVHIMQTAVSKGYTLTADGSGVIGRGGQPLKLRQVRRKGGDPYQTFGVFVNGEKKWIRFHRFVAFLKFGEAMFTEGLQVRHVNGDSLDNSWENLALGTARENSYDKTPETRLAGARKASAARRIFTDSQVAEIHALREGGATLVYLGAKYNVGHTTIAYAVRPDSYPD